MYEVRKLEAGDAVEYRDIRLEALEACPEAFGASYAEDQGLPVARYEGALAANQIYGGFKGGQLQGVIAVSRPNFIKTQHKAAISGIYVRNGARGTGLSDELLKFTFHHAGKKIECLHARTATANEAAVALFKRNAFDIYGTEARALRLEDGRYVDEYLMCRTMTR
ncbi:MAG: RimJ/RimL family protein N-acetyltransferase [Alphaproteobacteria bacterium]|jgi:RimJ/RimL family protein N-acetyltransferase